MKKLLKSLSASFVVVGALSANFAYAQSTAAVVCPNYKQGPTQIPGQRVGKKVQAAFEAYNNDQVDEAIAILKDIDASDEFDQAYVNRFVGNLIAGKEGHGKEALIYLLKSVKTKQLNDSEHAITLRLIGDLNMQEKNYEDAIKWYDAWIDFTCKQDPDIFTRQAQAYYETKQLAKMIAPADKAIALFEKPNKNPYVLKMTSYYERKMYPETIKVAETLVKLFPDSKQWWTQLGFFYMLVEDYKKALATFELAYTQGYLSKSSEINALVQLYATNEIPYKSAVLHEKYVDSGLLKKDATNLARIANSFHRAKEFVKAARYYGEAAALSSDPEHYRKQGTLLLGAEKYPEAIKALKKALDAGVQKKGSVHMAIMESYFYQGKFREAYKHIKEAGKDSSTSRSAKAWEPYIKEKAKNRGIKL
ncbi:tetratricopeptide repeat protein [Alteromonas sp. a30]|uniref:tetratricopeptide repeat protein n=1 Tax=Alteromonas sp. a30 TaxID=2730917 RepID=UPI002281D291|nr:tetratricopeptide repeat protein [Alteromonas sp. a30]MCY7295948.1 tetratricopeptide repeat protein [Alteromonas sp. a30]